MACVTSAVLMISLLILSCQYDWTKCAPVTEGDDLALIRYIARDLPRQLDKRELIEEPFLRIDTAPDDTVQVEEGESVTLECEAIGVPPPVITWRKQGKRIKQADRDDETNAFEKLTNLGSQTLENSITVGRLRLDCVQPSMSGLYECVAENGYGKVTSQTRLIVTPKEAISPVSEMCATASNGLGETPLKPSIVMFTRNRLEVEGNNAQLFCRASGYPKPRITWLDMNEQPLQSNEHRYVLPNGDLFIKNGREFANYHCVASNSAGEDRGESFIYFTKKEDEAEESHSDA